MNSLNETITNVVTGKDPETEHRKLVSERIMRDTSHLKQIDAKQLSSFQLKELKKVTDKLFGLIGPSVKNFTIHKDSRFNADIEVHFPTPKTGVVFTQTDFLYLSKIKFFYVSIESTKIVVTFLDQ